MANTTSTNSTSQTSDSNTLSWVPWGNTPPIPGTSLSASGLLILADLQTIARRTVLTGTSSWFDAFVLAPGLHQQQQCEALSNSASKTTAASSSPSAPCTVKNTNTGLETEVTNTAMLGYLKRLAEGMHLAKSKGGQGLSRGVTLQVSQSQTAPSSTTPQSIAANLGLLALRRIYNRAKQDGVLSTVLAPLLYAIIPVLTVFSMSLMLATRDWWGVGILLVLMLARLLNIFVIKSRTSQKNKAAAPDSHCGIVCSLKNHQTPPKPTLAPKSQSPFLPKPSTLDPVPADNMASNGRAQVDGPGSISAAGGEKPSNLPFENLTTILPTLDKSTIPASYTLNLPGASTPIKIQGLASDMESLLSGNWMREKTNVEGYMEAFAKILVYGVAAVSGNMKQTGNIILGGLLVVSAAALALANSEKAGTGGREEEVAGRRIRVEGDVDGDGALSEGEKAGLAARKERAEGSAV